MTPDLPPLVAQANDRADVAGFVLSSEPGVGALLAAMAAAVPPRGRILELGTGAGVGLAWLVHGLGSRDDVELITVDTNAQMQSQVQQTMWPVPVSFVLGDGAVVANQLGRFHLIFADAPGGKIVKLQRTIDALEPGGVLVVDDMELSLHDHDPPLRDALALVRERLLSNDRLVCAELDFSSGVVVAVKRH
jgi:demethylmenaquinone methyltransferase/2-methoxy-6-polyprenyl-1,4-benzoquinol methylase